MNAFTRFEHETQTDTSIAYTIWHRQFNVVYDVAYVQVKSMQKQA